MSQVSPSLFPCLHTPCLGKLPRRSGGLAPNQPGDGTPETLCPCPSIQVHPLFPEMSSTSAMSSIPHFFFETPPISQASGQMLSKAALSLTATAQAPQGSLHLLPPLLSCSAFCWEAPIRHVLSAPIWTVFITADTQLWDRLTSLQPPSCPQESWCSFFSHFYPTPHTFQAVFCTAPEKDRDICPLPPVYLL